MKMFDHLVDKNELKSDFKKHLNLSDDAKLGVELTFIRELVKGVKNKVRTPSV